MTRDVWLARHPYLQPVDDLHEVIDSSAREIVVPPPAIPEWKEYLDDFVAGIPLLQCSNGGIDLSPAELMLPLLVEKLGSRRLPRELTHQISALCIELKGDKNSPGRALAGLLDRESFASADPGLLRYLGWTLLRRYLSPIVLAFSNWRDEESWLRNYCPTCGSPPCMAQFVGVEPNRVRLLCCGYCATRWRYRRTQCPFCERDEQRLCGFAIEGNPLRIDYCEACGGYLKTYHGEGSEDVFLADWTSLHVDIVARDRGFQRFSGSLFEL